MAQKSDKKVSSSPIDDLAYDLVTVLHQKSKALEAYDKYIGDCGGNPEVKQLFEQLKQEDTRAVGMLRDCVAQYLTKEGQQGETRGSV